MTTALAIRPEQGIDYSNPKVIQDIKNTVAKDATDSELVMFIGHCKGTGLDPFKREIWFIKINGRVQIMTGIQGFHAIANTIDAYDGMEIGLIGKEGEYLPLTYPKNDYIGAWAKVYRKDRKIPMEGVAMLSEYDKKMGNWKTMPRVMIQKCAESVALRKAFPQRLNDLYTKEEMPLEFGEMEVLPSTSKKQELLSTLKTADEIKPDVSMDNDDEVLNFGKYKGSRWSELPNDYLEWMVKNAKDAAYATRALSELERRQQDQTTEDPVDEVFGDDRPSWEAA